jgi:hypothetical protein
MAAASSTLDMKAQSLFLNARLPEHGSSHSYRLLHEVHYWIGQCQHILSRPNCGHHNTRPLRKLKKLATMWLSRIPFAPSALKRTPLYRKISTWGLRQPYLVRTVAQPYRRRGHPLHPQPYDIASASRLASKKPSSSLNLPSLAGSIVMSSTSSFWCCNAADRLNAMHHYTFWLTLSLFWR